MWENKNAVFKPQTTSSHSLRRLHIFFAGFITLVLAILVATGVIDAENILQFVLFKEILAVVGVLTMLAGFLLFLLK